MYLVSSFNLILHWKHETTAIVHRVEIIFTHKSKDKIDLWLYSLSFLCLLPHSLTLSPFLSFKLSKPVKEILTMASSILKKATWQGLFSKLAKHMKASATSMLSNSTAAMKDIPCTWNTKQNPHLKNLIIDEEMKCLRLNKT